MGLFEQAMQFADVAVGNRRELEAAGVTRAQVRTLCAEAYEAGDFVMAAVCEAACDRWASVGDAVKMMSASDRATFLGFGLDGDPGRAARMAADAVRAAAARAERANREIRGER
jgi:hypothetical protein